MRRPLAYCCIYLGHEDPWTELGPYQACADEASKAFLASYLTEGGYGPDLVAHARDTEYSSEVWVTQVGPAFTTANEDVANVKYLNRPKSYTQTFAAGGYLVGLKKTTRFRFGQQPAKEESL
ncbi:hypothetical protein RF11_15705 [Thelohanellus kitauei]|uniref:Uncharacterized protein n=1 Tax=Thelohanellus kitauei TaxID=669202 RepID=A0A0C2N7K3_THEKT|nr:hypothetical protein RF11_15705 [Thelohanellus kitauei]